MFRLLGRDPMKNPLTPLERAIFLACLSEHVSEEKQTAPLTGENPDTE